MSEKEYCGYVDGDELAECDEEATFIVVPQAGRNDFDYVLSCYMHLGKHMNKGWPREQTFTVGRLEDDAGLQVPASTRG